MWMRCRFCGRTVLVLAQLIPSPFYCDRCEAEGPKYFRERDSRMLANAGSVVMAADLGTVEVFEGMVIDVTQEGE